MGRAIVANMFARGGRRAFRGNVFFLRVFADLSARDNRQKKKNDGTFDTQLRYARRAQQWARDVLRETLHCHALRLMEPRLIDNALALFSLSLSFLSFFFKILRPSPLISSYSD